MCSIDYEMVISHSPPVFGCSPPTRSHMNDYSSFRFAEESTFPRAVRNPLRALQHSHSLNTLYHSSSKPIAIAANKMPKSPKRPCLVIRPPSSDESSSSSDEDTLSPNGNKLKKKVVFADDKGMSLTHVRIMREPSNVPPIWSFQFLTEVTRGINADPVGDIDHWQITFPQPASDYVAFRKRLENEKVSLENVIVKETEDSIIGTVKVSNIAFEKEVIIRSSTNSWKSYEDAFCEYVPNNITSNAYVIYDTFSFKMLLPPKANRIEFCVCYRCNDTDYWDNNHQQNYVIVKKMSAPLHKSLSNDDLFDKRDDKKPTNTIRKCADISQAKLESWSEFASWNHLENSNPYW